MLPLALELPFPPSVNKYWRSVHGRNILTDKARDYRERSKKELATQLYRLKPRPEQITFPVAVKVLFHAPDRRKRDLDNFTKATLDAITHAGIWADDSLVHDLRLAWGERRKGGMARVSIDRIWQGSEFDLAPCPFCGCKAIHAIEYMRGLDGILRFHVQCPACRGCGGDALTKTEAIAMWNQGTGNAAN